MDVHKLYADEQDHSEKADTLANCEVNIVSWFPSDVKRSFLFDVVEVIDRKFTFDQKDLEIGSNETIVGSNSYLPNV